MPKGFCIGSVDANSGADFLDLGNSMSSLFKYFAHRGVKAYGHLLIQEND